MMIVFIVDSAADATVRLDDYFEEEREDYGTTLH